MFKTSDVLRYDIEIRQNNNNIVYYLSNELKSRELPPTAIFNKNNIFHNRIIML